MRRNPKSFVWALVGLFLVLPSYGQATNQQTRDRSQSGSAFRDEKCCKDLSRTIDGIKNDINSLRNLPGKVDKLDQRVEGLSQKVEGLSQRVEGLSRNFENLPESIKSSPNDEIRKAVPEKRTFFGIEEKWFWLGLAAGSIILNALVVLIIVLRTRKAPEFPVEQSLSDIQDRFSRSLEEQKRILEQIQTGLPSSTAIRSGISEDLKSRFDRLHKELSEQDKSEPERQILEIVKRIQAKIEGDLQRLGDRERDVIRKEAEWESKYADADRKIADAEQKIRKRDDDISRAVEAAKVETQTAMQRSFNAEREKNHAELKRLQETIDGLNEKMLQLKTEQSELKTKESEAECRGFKRGKDESQETIQKLTRENAVLGEQQKQAADREKRLKIDFERQTAEVVREKEKELEQRLASAEETVRESLEKQYRDEIVRLADSLKNRENDLASASKQKDEAEDRARTLQTRLDDATAKAKELQDSLRKAEQESEETAEQLKSTQDDVRKMRQEKQDLAKTAEDRKIAIARLEEDKKTQEKKLSEVESLIVDLKKSVYPPEFLSDPDFAALKERLDGWIARKMAGAWIVNFSLGLWSQKNYLNSEARLQVLHSISVGITQVFRAENKSANEVLDELVRWRDFLVKFSNNDFRFKLQIPDIGATFESSWMKAENNAEMTRVRSIRTWAVFNQKGFVQYRAEVE